MWHGSSWTVLHSAALQETFVAWQWMLGHADTWCCSHPPLAADKLAKLASCRERCVTDHWQTVLLFPALGVPRTRDRCHSQLDKLCKLLIEMSMLNMRYLSSCCAWTSRATGRGLLLLLCQTCE